MGDFVGAALGDLRLSKRLLRIVESYAEQTAARGAGLATVDSLNMVLVSVLVFLILRQVMPIAAGLASGVALNTFGTVSRLVTWGGRLIRS